MSRKRRHPAVTARAVTAGLSTGAMVGMVFGLAHDGPSSASVRVALAPRATTSTTFDPFLAYPDLSIVAATPAPAVAAAPPTTSEGPGAAVVAAPSSPSASAGPAATVTSTPRSMTRAGRPAVRTATAPHATARPAPAAPPTSAAPPTTAPPTPAPSPPTTTRSHASHP